MKMTDLELDVMKALQVRLDHAGIKRLEPSLSIMKAATVKQLDDFIKYLHENYTTEVELLNVQAFKVPLVQQRDDFYPAFRILYKS
ncbi:hypothetical protein NCTGTJJY_CDS0126 [Serratia phage 92A1]|nr:hypothetical protein NCTGTJJY_CDS0126 [Serratia phage 92A1]